ncbi:NTF2-like N-terminal transpeptidase domain-containing protein [Riemerella anatipestifer]|nr:NTF2-like N-terminal transpeptidase domain-containing protein [Riemerella anatipestifer]MDY3324959.1 NTF2-like N-terminal transpeptidase domain-containing protein [Riemerella anatipestifer]MDY3353768.1 NTF2-like N-terminal transpeptidase domain-containing protein [Riemerella anatipestifer]
MNKLKLLPIFFLLFFMGCKKDQVDGSNIRAFQSSINDMSSSLTTLEQVKFNEALYILKTFGVEADGDIQELNALSKLLDGKKVPEILAMANEVAAKNELEWSSTSPPSLGNMNIFQSQEPAAIDPNDVKASSISLQINPVSVDSVLGAKALQVVPRLLDTRGNLVDFSNAGLETTLEIYSNDIKLLTSKRLMTDNNFKGFYVNLASIPQEKVTGGVIDIKVTVRTAQKFLQMARRGMSINSKVLKQPVVDETTPTESIDGEIQEQQDETIIQPKENTSKVKAEPKSVVSKFLNNLGSNNLRAAYEISSNPKWGSYDQFSNPTSGFGSVKNITVKNISTQSSSDNSATVNASYNVTDNNGNTSALEVTYTLKSDGNSWKITNYKINSTQKQ